MEDQRILAAFEQRDETALQAVQTRYGAYLRTVAGRILDRTEDAEEGVSDALLAAWNSIPPQHPENLKTYLAKLTRRACLKILRTQQSERRGGKAVTLAFEELDECLADASPSPEEKAVSRSLTESLNRFLEGLPKTERALFIRRYWYFLSVKELSAQFGFTESKTESMLLRTRRKLRVYLEKEGYER